jgi:mitochondrial enoyl-[acyl-carrier protein] reductase / trans-2-enoyl-CoA reductase
MPRRATFQEFGAPAEVVKVESFSSEPLPTGHVRLAMAFAPINPADLNYAEGVYGVKPELPARIGNEGVGRVREVGSGVDLELGAPAIPLAGLQTWTEELVLAVKDVLILPKGIPLEQAAQLRVNPLTAACLLSDFGQLQEGDWVVQNAGNSAVSLAVTQLARKRGIKVLSLVRSPAAAACCEAYGAQHVVIEGPEALRQSNEMMAGAKAKLALNSVGGESALRLANLLADRGFHVSYGAMGRQKLSLPNRFLIFQEHQFVGFWLTRWLERTPAAEVRAIYTALAEDMQRGDLRLPVAAKYSLDELGAALEHAAQGGRNGKVLLSLGDGV